VPLDAKPDIAPTEVSLQFENFKVEQKLQAKPNSNLELASGLNSVPESKSEKP
jgi:hypothetical protein